jgi:hypothetical protein
MTNNPDGQDQFYTNEGEWRSRSLEMRLKLIENQSVSERDMIDAFPYLTQRDYQDVVTERSIGKWCGCPLCDRSLTTKIRGAPYKISLLQRKVFDVKNLNDFCSKDCALISYGYMKQLPYDPIYLRLRRGEKIPSLLNFDLVRRPVSNKT